MTHNAATWPRSIASGAFTLFGNRSYPTRFGLACSALLTLTLTLTLVAPAAAAAERPQRGPTSSASVKISLSVAPRYGLKRTSAAVGRQLAGAAGPGTLCISTNGPQTLLPVMLVRSATGDDGSPQSGDETDRLAWCGLDGGALENAPDRINGGSLIIRPE